MTLFLKYFNGKKEFGKSLAQMVNNYNKLLKRSQLRKHKKHSITYKHNMTFKV